MCLKIETKGEIMSHGIIIPDSAVYGFIAATGAAGAVVGLAAMPVSLGSMWLGKKVMSMHHEYEQGAWQKTALKFAGATLAVLGSIVGTSASLVSGMGTALALGVLGATVNPVFGVLGVIAGIAVGILSGCAVGRNAWEAFNEFDDKKAATV